MSENQSKLQCEIVQDLLPLYHDGVVNTVTQKAVAEHLESCESCAMEYRLLKTELPTEATPKSKFAAFTQMMKKKRIVTSIIAAILACALLIGTFYVLTQVPLVDIPDSELPVYRAYRYEVEGEKYFFVLYGHPWYNCVTHGTVSTYEDETDGYTLVMNWEKTVLGGRFEDKFTEDLFNSSASGIDEDFDTFKFNNTVIWTEAENADDSVPDYVYALHNWQHKARGYDVNVEENYIRIEYTDGHVMQWDLDGNLLYDSAAETP